MARRAAGRTLVRRAVVLVAGAAVVLGCVGRAQAFADWNGQWRAEVSDRTGTVDSIDVLDRAGPGAALAADTVRVRNLGPSTIEVAWLGGTCVAAARFSLATEPHDAIALRYELGGPCDQLAPGGYALEIRFAHPIDAATIDPIPDWGP